MSGIVGEPKHLITGMNQSGSHQTRSLFVPSWDPNKLIVSRGSQGNVDMAAINPSTGRSMIKYWSIDEFIGSPMQFSSTGTILGMGLRNSVGVTEDPTTGGIVGSIHNRKPIFNLGRVTDQDGSGRLKTRWIA